MSTAASLTFPTTPPSKLRSNASQWYTRPSTSSPLAHNQSSSPIAEAQARRRSQFKSQQSSASSSRVASSSESSSYRRNNNSSSRYATPAQLSLNNETPQVAFLRQRFKKKCIESAKKARQNDRNMRRWASDTSSDSVDVEMDQSNDVDKIDENEDDDAILNDEIFRRIVANERRKSEHAFRLSYELDVGSSIDPDMMDVAQWEAELKHNDHDDELPPEDLLDAVDDAELAALYEELEREQQQQQLQRQQQQEDDQRWEALLDDPLDDEFLCAETPVLTDQMES